MLAQAQAARPKRPGVHDASKRIPIEKLKPDHVFDVPGTPDWLAIDEHVWVSNEPKNSVTRIDPKANTVVATITVGKEPVLRPGRRVRQPLGAELRRLDHLADRSEDRQRRRRPSRSTIGNDEGGLAAGAGSVWMMTDTKGTLARIDPATNKRRRRDLRRARIVRGRVRRRRRLGHEHREERR